MNFAVRFNAVSRVLLAFLVLNLTLVDTMLPILTFLLFTDSVAFLPAPVMVLAGVAAWTFSGPGLVAAFAAVRDAPSLRLEESERERRARLDRVEQVTAIARPYWSDADDTRMVRPYFRAYVRLFRRSIGVSVIFGLVTGSTLAAGLGAVRLPGPAGVVVPALLFAFSAYALLAETVACAVIVEFPRARRAAVVRNGFLLSARGWRTSTWGLAILGVYGYALLHWPFLVVIFGTSLTCFFLYHVAEVVIRPVRELIIHEETPAPGPMAAAPDPSA